MELALTLATSLAGAWMVGSSTSASARENVRNTRELRSLKNTPFEQYPSVMLQGSKGYIRESVGNIIPPTGTIIMFAGDVVPDGWLVCDGRKFVDIVNDPSSKYTDVIDFKDLISVLGIGTSNLPDLRGRVPIGTMKPPTGTGTDPFPDRSKLGTAISEKPVVPEHFHTLDRHSATRHKAPRRWDRAPLTGVNPEWTTTTTDDNDLLKQGMYYNVDHEGKSVRGIRARVIERSQAQLRFDQAGYLDRDATGYTEYAFHVPKLSDYITSPTCNSTSVDVCHPEPRAHDHVIVIPKQTREMGDTYTYVPKSVIVRYLIKV